MQRKKQNKKQRKKKKQGDKIHLTPEEESRINALIQKSGITDPKEIAASIPDSRHAQVLIDRLCMEKDVPIPLLLAIQETFEDKPTKRAIKQALFKLKQKGLEVEEQIPPNTPAPAIFQSILTEEPSAFIGPLFDTMGSRYILIVFPRATQGQDVGIGMVSNEMGFQQFMFGTFSKKRVKKIKEDLLQNAGPLVETTLAHATTILEKIYASHKEVSAEAPQDYLQLRPRLIEKCTPLEHAPIYSLTPSEKMPTGIIVESQMEKLFGHNLMSAWLIDHKDLRPYIEEISKVFDSPIVLAEAQKEDRARQIRQKCADEIFSDSKKSELKASLEEMAYFYLKQDEEELSRICLAGALSLDEKDSAIRINPVIEFLLNRSLDLYMDAIHEKPDEEEPPDDASPLILT